MHRLIAIADRLHARARGVRALGWFAWSVRVLLAAAFLPSGLVKVLGLPFTRLDPRMSEVGRLFAALEHDFGALYPFIGACQLAAAVLLLVPRTALVGALVHLPITARHRGDHDDRGFPRHLADRVADAARGGLPGLLGLAPGQGAVRPGAAS